MIKEGKFGTHEAICLVSIAACTKIFYTSPGYLSRFVGSAGWLMTMISNLVAIIAFSIILLLFHIYPGKNIIEIFELSLGRFLGVIFSVIYAAYFLFASATVLREFVDIFKIYVLPETPITIMTLCVLLVIVPSATIGLESIARTAKLLAYFTLICFFSVLLLCVENYRAENIFPIFGYGINAVIKHGALRCSAYDEVMILTVFASSLQGTKFLRRAGYFSLFISGGIIALALFCFSLAFPAHQLQQLASPMFVLARSISYGAFFQRLDPLYVFMWMLCTLITIVILFYVSGSCLSKAFRIQDSRPALFPLSVFLYIVAMVPQDFLAVVGGEVQMIREFGWMISFILPIIALIVTGFRRMVGE